jgi:ubiquitin C
MTSAINNLHDPIQLDKDKSYMIQVFVKIQNGRTMIVEVPRNSNIQMIKSQIYKKQGIPICKQRLIYNTKELENDNTLSFYNIQPESNLMLNLKLGGGVHIIVKTLEGTSVEIDIDEEDTIETLKYKIYEKEGISVENQRLIYERKKLDDHKTLSDYKMKEFSSIHLVKAAVK